MFEFICLFLPSFISLSKLNVESFNFYKLIIIYSKYNIAINFLVFLFYQALNPKNIVVINKNMFTVNFGLKYLLLATIFANILPTIIKLINENIQLKIEMEKNK